jgi:hypothetical protein
VDEAYRRQVALLVRVLPHVAVEPDFVVVASGVVEIALGLALIALPRYRVPVGWIVAAFFVANNSHSVPIWNRRLRFGEMSPVGSFVGKHVLCCKCRKFKQLTDVNHCRYFPHKRECLYCRLASINLVVCQFSLHHFITC